MLNRLANPFWTCILAFVPRTVNPAPEVQSVQSFPSPVLADNHLLVRVSASEADYNPVQPGTPHPQSRNWPGFFFLKQLPIDPSNPDWVFRVYCNNYASQDTYNYEIEYSAGDILFPIYTRDYLELRSTYTPRTKLATLTGIYGAKVTAGGTNYTQNTVSAVVAGAGSGATVLPIVTNGAVTHVIVLTEGTSYTPTPTITISDSGTGAGATAVALIQSLTALLVEERLVRTRDDNDSMFVRVRRRWETLPGPATYTPYTEEETGALCRRYQQRVAATTTPESLKAQYPAASGYFVWQSKVVTSTEDAVVGTMITEVMQKPSDRVEYVKGNFPVPSVLETGAAPFWVIPPAGPDIPPGPYAGVTYIFTHHAPASPLKLTYSYGIPGTAIPFSPVSPVDASLACYNVISDTSRILPMNSNTIHRAYTITAVTGPTVVEDIQASVPAAYAAGDHVIDVDQQQWKGSFERRIVTTASFPAPSITP